MIEGIFFLYCGMVLGDDLFKIKKFIKELENFDIEGYKWYFDYRFYEDFF